MRSRRRRQSAVSEREERKRRQEKFRKRSGSLFNKARLLAKDTDAWVALIVRDKVGQVRTLRSSSDSSWPPSINDLIKSHPSGTHEFFEMHDPWNDWTEVGLNDLADTELYTTDADDILRVDDTQNSNVTTAIEPENDQDTTIRLACQPAKAGTSVSDPIGDNHDASIDAIGDPETPAAVTQQSDEPLEHDVTGDHTTPDNPSFSLTKESNGLELSTHVESEHATDPIEEFEVSCTDTMDEFELVVGDLDVTGSKIETLAASNIITSHNTDQTPENNSQNSGHQCVSTMPPRIDLRKLRESWDWVFQRPLASSGAES
ncbi:hypothetical protein F5884DRAFT_862700 [Xylogone sp. PMI_703]|nr:hypothetical protein F5884DRAFT_862700 [Xylogone sp. PMI_703]